MMKTTAKCEIDPLPFARAYPFVIFLLALIAAWLGTGLATAAEVLSLDQFLAQVESGNQNIVAAKTASQGAGLRLTESSLLYSPILDATAQWVHDKRHSPFLAYDQFVNDSFEVGISEQTPFGLHARLSYNLTQTGYEGLNFGTQASPPVYYYGSPKIELTFDLWRNLFGSETQSEHDLIEAGALATKYGQSYQAKASRAAAETAYIKLAAARELDLVNRNSFGHAQEIYDWNLRRSKLNLNENSDLYQAEANLESLRLSVAMSADALRSASRAFNQARGVDGDDVKEAIQLPDPKSVQTPQRAELRDDVRSAREQQRVASAQAQMGKEKNKPTLQLFGTYARNSQEVSKTDAFSESFNANEPTKAVGVRLSMPLLVGDSANARDGYGKERIAAEKLADQKIFDQEVEWKDLVQKLADAKERLTIAEKLADIQKRKSTNERDRLKHGRSTTYQSLIFETDYNQAEYQRIQTQSEVLSLLAQMKTFGG
jgi:outer membrane protein TolC